MKVINEYKYSNWKSLSCCLSWEYCRNIVLVFLTQTTLKKCPFSYRHLRFWSSSIFPSGVTSKSLNECRNPWTCRNIAKFNYLCFSFFFFKLISVLAFMLRNTKKSWKKETKFGNVDFKGIRAEVFCQSTGDLAEEFKKT